MDSQCYQGEQSVTMKNLFFGLILFLAGIIPLMGSDDPDLPPRIRLSFNFSIPVKPINGWMRIEDKDGNLVFETLITEDILKAQRVEISKHFDSSLLPGLKMTIGERVCLWREKSNSNLIRQGEWTDEKSCPRFVYNKERVQTWKKIMADPNQVLLGIRFVISDRNDQDPESTYRINLFPRVAPFEPWNIISVGRSYYTSPYWDETIFDECFSQIPRDRSITYLDVQGPDEEEPIGGYLFAMPVYFKRIKAKGGEAADFNMRNRKHLTWLLALLRAQGYISEDRFPHYLESFGFDS
jgi:hypothetical protein